MRISEAAQRAGVLATTIRFYESIGLLPAPHRINGQRIYGPEVLDRLAVIRFGLKTGFSLKELKSLFLGVGSRAKRRHAAQGKLKELKGLRDRVELMERLLKEISLCRCGTIQEIAERVMKSDGPNYSSLGRRVSARVNLRSAARTGFSKLRQL
jgi:MerR family transcriptional regulator, redox-sensitive transcriptional activator SoxR